MAIIYFAQYTSPQKGPIGYRWHIAAPQLPALFLDALKEALDSHNAFPEDGRTLPQKFCGGLFLNASINLGAVFRFIPGQPDAAGRSGKIVLNCLCFSIRECQGKSLRPLRESPVLSDCTEENRSTEMSITIPLICNDVLASSEKNFDHFLKENLSQDQLILLKNEVIHSYTQTNRPNLKMQQPFVPTTDQDKMYNPPRQASFGIVWKCSFACLLIGIIIGLAICRFLTGEAVPNRPIIDELQLNGIYLKTEKAQVKIGDFAPQQKQVIINIDLIPQNISSSDTEKGKTKAASPQKRQEQGEHDGKS